MTPFQIFIEPLLRYEFMQNAMMAAAIVGVTSAVLSCLLVVRHQALLGDAVSHAVLPGVVIGWLVGRHIGIFWGAMGTAVAAAVAITYIERHSRVKRDAVMGIVFTFAFAVGLAVLSVAKPTGIDLFHVLLGNVLGVDKTDLLLTAASGAVVLGAITVRFRALRLWSFDPVMAEAGGLRTGVLHYLFTALLSATIVASLQAVGLVLVIAMLVTPGATALLLTRRLSTMMVVAAALGLTSSVSGMYGSYYFDVASGPMIVIVASVLFGLALCLAPRRGLLSQIRHRHAVARRVLGEDLLKVAGKAVGSVPIVELNARANVSASRLRAVLRRWVREGIADVHDGVVELTSKGHEEALRMVQTHRLLESHLHSAEGVALPDLHEAADHLEHHVSRDRIRVIDDELGKPRVDPHGHPIPRSTAELRAIAGSRLTDVQPSMTGTVAMVADDRPDLLGAMARAGILPQQVIVVDSPEAAAAGDGMAVTVGGHSLRLPSEVTDRIWLTDVVPSTLDLADRPVDRVMVPSTGVHPRPPDRVV